MSSVVWALVAPRLRGAPVCELPQHACPFCRSGWLVCGRDSFMRQCREQQASWPQIAASCTRYPALPSDSVVAFCCQHLWLVEGSRPKYAHAWIELPSCHMAWAPLPHHAGPVPSFLDCAEHGLRALAAAGVDLFSSFFLARKKCFPSVWLLRRRWSPRRSLPMLPSPAPTAWLSRGPPRDYALFGGNSWLFVPLWHAGAGALRSDAAGQWEAHPFLGQLWRGALLDFLAPRISRARFCFMCFNPRRI